MPTMTDLFCGGGGSATGANAVPGVQVRLALNHSRDAVDTHEANHPHTLHDCADISQVDPAKYPRTDILWASPECTNYSNAKGVKRNHGEWNNGLWAEDGTDEAAIRSRATMWDVPRFAEAHAYRAVIVENVVENRWWGPKHRPGAVYDAWVNTMRAWGYEHRAVYLNSMFAQGLGGGAPQSRDRKFDIFWREGERAPDLDKWTRPWALCPRHGRIQALQGWKTTKKCHPLRPWGRYGANRQYLWRCPRTECRNHVVEPEVRAASEVIDWGLPAPTIGERTGEDALKPATLRRIKAGLDEFGRPYLVPMEGRDGKKALPIEQPMRTCSTRNETAIAIPPYMVELRGGASSHRAITAPLSAVTAGGLHHGVVSAPDMVLPYYSASAARPADRPLGAVTTVEGHAAVYGRTISDISELPFRMLEPHEYQAAMDFPPAYVLTPPDKRTRVRLLGNAVTPCAARDLLAAVTESITGEEITPAAAYAQAA